MTLKPECWANVPLLKALGSLRVWSQVLRGTALTYCGWTKSVSHRLQTKVDTTSCWYVQGNGLLPGFLRRCEMDFVHPQEGRASSDLVKFRPARKNN